MSSIKDFEVLNTLGSGSFSSVYKVKRISDGQQYALKKVKFPSLKSKEKDNALNEVRILASISDANIIAYKQAFFDEPSQCLCIIMELASGGDLLKKISDHKKKNERIPEDTLWAYLIQMTQGLKTLHDMKILHRDLKSANIFLSSDGKSTKLGDLNVSKIAEKGLVHTQAGTPYYASPEVWQNKPYGAKSDIWSLGCVMYELCTFMPPFRAQSMSGLYQKVIKGSYDKIPSFYSQDLIKIISACLNVKPESRPSCEKILSHPGVSAKMTQEQIINSKRASTHNELLDTIKVPRLMKKLTQMLPKANYQQRETVSLIDLDAMERRPPSRLSRADSNTINTINIKKDMKEDSLERVLKSKDLRPAKKQSSLPPIDNAKKGDKSTVIQRAALAVLSNALDVKTNLSGVRENNILDENKENERKNANIYYNNDVRRNIRAVY